MSTFARLCRAAILFCSAAALPLSIPAQQTRRVPQDFPTIQAAINAAATGDTVLVAPGTYFENLTLDTKEITLTSSAGASKTILDGQQQRSILAITNTPGMQTLITGFTFQNGNSFGASQTYGPAGIFLSHAGAVIRGNTFTRNIGYNVYVLNGSANVTGNTLSTAGLPNSPCLTSGGISAYASTGITVSGPSTIPPSLSSPPGIFGNTIVGDGTSCSGDAVQVLAAGPTALPIQGNTLRNSYRAVTATSPVLISQNLIYDNRIGGLNLYTPSTPPNVDPATTFVINNTLVNNVTTSDPGSSVRSDVLLSGTVARTALINNILVGTSGHTVLRCETVASPSINDTPLIFDHNDLYNPANATDGLVAGDCFPDLTAPLSSNGNLSLDPRFTSTSDFHPIFGSPVIDAGNDSAPGIIARGTDPSTVDFDGNPRVVGSTGNGYANVDLGVYEQQLGYNSFNSTAVTLVASAYETSLGSVTLTASVAASSIYFGNSNPGGRITFYQNGQSLGQVELPYQGEASLSVPLTAAGLFGFTASFFPPESVGPSISPVLYVRAITATTPTTTLTLAATPATQTLNQPITLTIHLGSTTGSGSAPGPVPPGAVTLSEGSTLLSTLQPDATGLATYTIPKPSFGNHTYTVNYAGTTLFPAAAATTSASITAPAATTLSVIATPALAPLNTPVLCTVHVTAASSFVPTGILTFTDGATSLGSVTLTAVQLGLANFALSNLSFGLHTVTVTFTGDPGFASSAGTCTVNVGGDSTLTTLTSSKNPAAATDAVTYTAIVTNTGSSGTTTAPAGSVTLSEGNTLLASAPLVAGTSGSSSAILSAILTLPGVHILSATYLPATTNTFTSTGTVLESITAPPVITTTLSATPNPVPFGQPTTLSATVTSAAAIPAPATITFLDGATVLGTVALPPTGPATLSTTSLSVGLHQIGAILHTADTTAIRSTALPLTLQVSGLPDSLTLSVSPAPTAFATAPLTLTALLSPTSAVPSGTSLSGAITFLDGSLPLGTATLSADGRATFTTSTLTPGTHILTAAYSGNSILAATTATAVTEQITTNPTTTSLAIAPAASTAFTPITLAAHVASATSATRINTLACPPTCTPITVTFVSNSATGPTTLGVVPVDASGNAILALNPPAGTFSITAAFSGSPLFAPSSSAPSPLTLAAAPTALTLTANPNPVYQHGKVTLIAALTAPGIPPAALADGTVTFVENSTPLGTATIPAAQAFAYTPTTVGTHTLTAVFSGTTNLVGSSATVTVTVLPSDFVLSVKDPTLTLATTHHAPTTITINTTGSLADQIDLSCANLPQFATCTFSPATHDLTQTNTTTGTLTLDTDALLNYARTESPVSPLHHLLRQTGTLLALCLPLGLLATRKQRRRCALNPSPGRLPNLLTLLLLSFSALTLAGCSGLYPGHTAPGTYTITITGHARTSAIEHSTQLTLVVTP